MQQTQKLSQLVNEIDVVIRNRFIGQVFSIKAEITDVKKQPDKRWCFLKFIEKDGNTITTEVGAVFWSNAYHSIESFERHTQQKFVSGIEITCMVKVIFHKRFGIRLEVQDIDYAYEIGKLEFERKKTLERLVTEGIAVEVPSTGRYFTRNNQLPLPQVFQKIALVASVNTDGYRDFKKVVEQNKYGYSFSIVDFATQVQGDNAAQQMIAQLEKITAGKEIYDVVVIVRGGGSDTDFKSFDDFELAKCVGMFPMPVLTGIGHDRNTSITDLMARQHKTPTEVGTYIVDSNWDFEDKINQLKDRVANSAERSLENARNTLDYYKRIVASASPETILNRGFAMIMHKGKIITDPAQINEHEEIETYLKDEIILSTVNQKKKNGNDLR